MSREMEDMERIVATDIGGVEVEKLQLQNVVAVFEKILQQQQEKPKDLVKFSAELNNFLHKYSHILELPLLSVGVDVSKQTIGEKIETIRHVLEFLRLEPYKKDSKQKGPKKWYQQPEKDGHA